MSDMQIERLKNLPKRSNETWQGGWVRAPGWVAEGDEEPHRLWIPFWVSVQSDTFGHVDPCRAEEKNYAKVLTALVRFACDHKRAGCRPGRLEVNDSALAEHLSGMLAEAGIRVVFRDNLPALDRCLADMAEYMDDKPPHPGPLDGDGVTVERMRRFAEAAKAFYEAALWHELIDEDVIRIESPSAPEGLGFACVRGAAGKTCGLGFLRSHEDYWMFHSQPVQPGEYYRRSASGRWSLLFGEIWEFPGADAELWEDHDLPIAGKQAYPCVFCSGASARIRRADAAVLTFVEGLLLVLAATTEEEIDSGRWTRQVQTADGMIDFTLALPDLLEPPSHEELFRRGVMPDRRAMERTTAHIGRYFAGHPASSADEMNEIQRQESCGKTPDEIEFTPATPLEKAQDLCYQAFDARGRRKVQLAKKAIEICPDCADAYVILAERTSNLEKRRGLYTKAVEAGERALGEDRIKNDAGHFWDMTDTRPYMRARFGLAGSLEAMGATEEAVGHYQALLHLNPGDNQGVRFILIPKLIELGQDAAALRVLDECGHNRMASLLYSRALLTFRAEGDGSGARASLREARHANPRVGIYLRAECDLPLSLPPVYRMGTEQEAVACAAELSQAWQATPGAVEWLIGQEREAE